MESADSGGGLHKEVGMANSREFKGHRRFYNLAFPAKRKILQSVRHTGSEEVEFYKVFEASEDIKFYTKKHV